MSRVPTNNNTFSSIKIRENINSGADKITISASNIDSDYTLTLPPNDGNTDQVLTTNGSGILSWKDQSGGGGGGGNSVLITGDQTISGTKTFNSTIIVTPMTLFSYFLITPTLSPVSDKLNRSALFNTFHMIF